MKLPDNVPSEPAYSPGLTSAGNRNIFKVPAAYFDQLPENVARRIQQENAGAGLTSLGLNGPPEGQPDHLSEASDHDINDSPSFSCRDLKATGQPDILYFENLADRILSKINKEATPAGLNLAEISVSDPFTVPEGYFLRLPDLISKKSRRYD